MDDDFRSTTENDEEKELSDGFLDEDLVESGVDDMEGMHIEGAEEEPEPDLGETFSDGRFEE